MRLKIWCDGECEKFCKIFWEVNKALESFCKLWFQSEYSFQGITRTTKLFKDKLFITSNNMCLESK